MTQFLKDIDAAWTKQGGTLLIIAEVVTVLVYLPIVTLIDIVAAKYGASAYAITVFTFGETIVWTFCVMIFIGSAFAGTLTNVRYARRLGAPIHPPRRPPSPYKKPKPTRH